MHLIWTSIVKVKKTIILISVHRLHLFKFSFDYEKWRHGKQVCPVVSRLLSKSHRYKKKKNLIQEIMLPLWRSFPVRLSCILVFREEGFNPIKYWTYSCVNTGFYQVINILSFVRVVCWSWTLHWWIMMVIFELFLRAKALLHFFIIMMNISSVIYNTYTLLIL